MEECFYRDGLHKAFSHKAVPGTSYRSMRIVARFLVISVVLKAPRKFLSQHSCPYLPYLLSHLLRNPF
jgi:hypothetical protein